jgi:hypothetical protein
MTPCDLPHRCLLTYPESLSEARRRPAPDCPAMAEAGRFEVQLGELLRATLAHLRTRWIKALVR